MIIGITLLNYELIKNKVQLSFEMRTSTNSLKLNKDSVRYNDISFQSFNNKVDKKGRAKAWLGILYFMVLMVSVILVFAR
jgi:hypothetical protein